MTLKELDDLPDCGYAILQLSHDDKNAYKLFSSTKEMTRMGLSPSLDDYTFVYSSALNDVGDVMELLEALYFLFNTTLPDGFKGHSLSVSDIVVIKNGDGLACYYVDAIGFKILPGFLPAE